MRRIIESIPDSTFDLMGKGHKVERHRPDLCMYGELLRGQRQVLLGTKD